VQLIKNKAGRKKMIIDTKTIFKYFSITFVHILKFIFLTLGIDL